MSAGFDTLKIRPAAGAAGSTRTRNVLLGLNLVGGPLVLASYAWGFLARPEAMQSLWGGVPEAARPLYTINMFLAAAGYLAFTSYLFHRVSQHAETTIAGRFHAGLLNWLYAMILIPSALWLPLTSLLLEHPSALLWVLIRIDLALVGLGALGLLFGVVALDAPRTRWRAAAVIGLLPFCLQTAVLDGLVWPAYFPSLPG